MKTKIIYDTDPGIDDVMALLFAHLSPAIEMVGITTGAGNSCVETTTRNALYIKERFGIPASVYKGAAEPLIAGPKQIPHQLKVIKSEQLLHQVHGEDGIGNIHPPKPTICVDRRSAIDFIIDTVMSYPGEITLVAVGRMTNLALALIKAPEIASNIKNVVVMGGALGMLGSSGNVSAFAEANMAGDPHAADQIFRAPWPLTMVGLDVTMKTIMQERYMQHIKMNAGETGEFIYKISRQYNDFYRNVANIEGIPTHDPSAIAYVIKPDLFKTQSGMIRVVTEGIAAGQTIMVPDDQDLSLSSDSTNTPKKYACIDVDTQGLLELYSNTICGVEPLPKFVPLFG
ncbi:MAG: nucleoside hydrolase [Pseudomonadales bacterium]|nr:nucleoside hydrolase [Pseudomonadales bacterium]